MLFRLLHHSMSKNYKKLWEEDCSVIMLLQDCYVVVVECYNKSYSQKLDQDTCCHNWLVVELQKKVV